MAGRGKKLKYDKNSRANAEWMVGKKLGRRKQQWVWDVPPGATQGTGHWEKV